MAERRMTAAEELLSAAWDPDPPSWLREPRSSPAPPPAHEQPVPAPSDDEVAAWDANLPPPPRLAANFDPQDFD